MYIHRFPWSALLLWILSTYSHNFFPFWTSQNPFLMLQLQSEECAKRIMNRALLIRWVSMHSYTRTIIRTWFWYYSEPFIFRITVLTYTARNCTIHAWYFIVCTAYILPTYRSMFELWGWGRDYSELEASIKQFPPELMVGLTLTEAISPAYFV